MPPRSESEEPQGPIEFDFIDGAVVRRAPKAKPDPAAPAPKVRSTVEPAVPRDQRSVPVPPAPAPLQPELEVPLPAPVVPPAAPVISRPEPKSEPAPEPVRPAPAPIVEIKPEPKPEPKSEPKPEPKPAPAPARPAPAPIPAAEKPVSPKPSPTPERPMPTPHSIDDFRRNAERQTKEQKSFGNVLATITYSILIAFVLVTGLAGYGGYILFKRIQVNETNLTEVDRRYEGELAAVKEDLKRTGGAVQQLQGDLGRQQDQIGRLTSALAKANSDLAASRKDIAALQSQVAAARPGGGTR